MNLFRTRHKSRRNVVGLYVVVALLVGGLWRLSTSLVGSQDGAGGAGGAGDGEVEPAGVYVASPQETHISSRHLLILSSINCTPPAIENFPRDYFTPEQRLHGAVSVHILIALYMFLGLAIACDEYFVPSLEAISDVLGLQPDVAGATFMAAGSSAPELAATVIGVFIAEDDIGLGAVVGSAVFNIMFVISVCALFAGMVVYLHWWPVFRDCACYTLSIIALVSIICDDIVHWYEAFILLVMYGLYILLMFFNPTLDAYFSARCTCCLHKQESTEENELISSARDPQKGATIIENGTSTMGSESEDDFTDRHSLLPSNGNFVNHKQDTYSLSAKAGEKDKEEEAESVISVPSGWPKRILWVISLPLLLPMFLTTPDCRQKRWKKCFFVTFFMSCVWISFYSYILIWMVTVIGWTMHIPDTVMALTFLAAGVSIPDAIASLIVAREGEGDMAVSNAIGSNVFDILLCMGLPWFLRTAIIEPGSTVTVYSSGLTYSSITLLSTVIFLLVSVHMNGWKLNKKYGIALMAVYFLFLMMATLYELNIFGYVHPPECHSDL